MYLYFSDTPLTSTPPSVLWIGDLLAQGPIYSYWRKTDFKSNKNLTLLKNKFNNYFLNSVTILNKYFTIPL